MDSYYFQFNEQVVEIKAKSCKLALLSFASEIIGESNENCEFKFLGKDYKEIIDSYGLSNEFSKKVIEDELYL